MKRRNMLIGIGGIAGAGAAIGTGAFDQVSADRTVSVDVEGDADAYLGLEVINDAYASTDGDGVLELDFDNADGGDGFNPNATTRINQIFSIVNRGSQDVGVSIEKGDLEDGVDKFDFIAQSPTDDESLVHDAPVLLESGESFDVGVEAEVSSSDAIDSVIEDGEITITADIEDEDDADELQPVAVGDQSFDTIGDGLEAAQEGDTVEVLTGASFEEDVSIDTEDVTLKATSNSKPTIVGQGTTDAVVNVNEPDVTIDGIAIEAPDMQGIDHNSGAPGLDVLDVTITQTDGTPSMINIADDDVLIEGTTIDGTAEDAGGTGVFIQEDNTGVEVRDSEIAGATTGITVQSPEVVIKGNEITEGDGGNEVGVTLTTDGTADGAEVKENTLEDLGTGVFVGPNDDVTIEDNSFAENDFHLNVDAAAGDFERSENEFDRAVETEDGDLAGFDFQLSIAPDIQTIVDITEEDGSVEVGDGEYEEDVSVATEGLSLEAAEEDEPTVVGQLEVTEEGVSVSGLDVEKEEDHALVIEDIESGQFGPAPEGVSITDNHLTRGGDSGSTVIVDSAEEILIEDNTIEYEEPGGGIGVELGQPNGEADSQVIGNDIIGGGDGQGIVLDATTEDTLVDENAISDVSTGIQAFPAFDDPNDGEIGENNEFENVGTEIQDDRD